MRILDYPWHQAHLYRLTALPAHFTVAQIRQPVWNEAQRPIPENVGFADPWALCMGDYDLALLHLDQWCDRLNTRAANYRLMRRLTRGIPQVVIMHGTPDSDMNRRAILQLIGQLPVVCNSRAAAAAWDGGEERTDAWGNPQFRAIIHGYRADDFFNEDLDYRRRAVMTVCSGNDMSREYHGIPLLERLSRDVPLEWYGPAGNRQWLTSYHAYRAVLASSLIYFSPTRRGPMPGARTEAMLSGACIVTVPGNDIERYIQQGVTGYVVHTYTHARAILRDLLNDPQSAYEIGQQGREAARVYFSSERYVKDWLAYLPTVGVEA